jgi:hydrogenase maturation factor
VDSRILGAGKLPIDVLSQKILSMTGAESKLLLTPPKAGLDFAAIRMGGGYLIVSADPITGVSSDIGEYAIAVSANDVATSGNPPQFAESVVLLPEGSSAEYAGEIAGQMDRAARRLGVTIVGGHTEVTPGLTRPIVAVTVFSFVKEYVSSQDAKEGDSIMMTKTAGLEGTAVLGGLRRFLNDISVVKEATEAFRTGAVHAMHDCTEGGVLGAAYEMSLASGLGFELREEAVPVAPETVALCRRHSLDPLKLIGSGALLISVQRGSEDKVEKALGRSARVTRVGSFTKSGRMLVRKDGSRRMIRTAPEDELWRVMARLP